MLRPDELIAAAAALIPRREPIGIHPPYCVHGVATLRQQRHEHDQRGEEQRGAWCRGLKRIAPDAAASRKTSSFFPHLAQT
jgi:hypothetical protein